MLSDGLHVGAVSEVTGYVSFSETDRTRGERQGGDTTALNGPGRFDPALVLPVRTSPAGCGARSLHPSSLARALPDGAGDGTRHGTAVQKRSAREERSAGGIERPCEGPARASVRERPGWGG